MTRSSRVRALILAVTVTAAVTLTACGAQAGQASANGPASGTGSAGSTGSGSAPAAANEFATVGALAPSGNFAGLNGHSTNVASLRGTPTMLWFIAAGCSSCTASIPALAEHLTQLKADGVHVEVIDLYDDLGQGPKGAAALSKLGRQLTGGSFTDLTWTWGISSRNLSLRYDPSGAPDVYFLLNRTGKIIYENGVPVSTMTQLLANARAAAA